MIAFFVLLAITIFLEKYSIKISGAPTLY